MKASILCLLTDMVGTCNLLQRARLPHSCQLALGPCARDESITIGLSSLLEKHLWFLPHVVSLHGKGFQPGSSVMNHSPKQARLLPAVEQLQQGQTRAAAFCKPAHGRGSSMCAWAPVPEHVKMLYVTGHSLVLYKYSSRWNGLCETSSFVMGMECGETETLTGRLVMLPDNLRVSGYLPKALWGSSPRPILFLGSVLG